MAVAAATLPLVRRVARVIPRVHVTWAAATPALLYLGIRLANIGLFWWMATINHNTFHVDAWDSGWYLGIAQHGYVGLGNTMLDAHNQHSQWSAMVFFPGYPLAIKLLSYPFTGNYFAAGVAVSAIAGVFAAYGVHRLARTMYPLGPAPMIAVALVAAAPMSITYSLIYPESLLVAFAAWTLVGIVEGRWWLALPCVIAAGYTSPMAVPLVAVTLITALVTAIHGNRRWDVIATLFLGASGLIGYVLWTFIVTGGEANYLTVQRDGWGTRFDFGRSSVQWLANVFLHGDYTYEGFAALLVLLAAGLAVLLARSGAPWPVWVYGAVCVAWTIASGGLPWDKPRLLLAAFPLLLPVAGVIARQRLAGAIAWTAGIGLFGLWYGAYALSVWHGTI